MYDVIAMGELLIDFTCMSVDADGYPTMAAHPGGAPANFLAALAKFGAKTAFIGKVGKDAFGELLFNTLTEGFGMSGLQAFALVDVEDVVHGLHELHGLHAVHAVHDKSGNITGN